MKKYPVVYSYKATNTRELELSIKTLANIKEWNGKIYVIGDPPNVLCDHIYKSVRFQRGNTRFKDEFLAYLTAAELVDGFIAMADDIFILKPCSVKNNNRGTLDDHIKQRNKSDIYTRHLQNTKAVLDLNGQPTLSYEIHAPFLVDSEKLWNIEPHMKSSNGFWRSIYGNWFNQDSGYAPDTKHAALNEDTVIYSSNNNSFNYDEVAKWL